MVSCKVFFTKSAYGTYATFKGDSKQEVETLVGYLPVESIVSMRWKFDAKHPDNNKIVAKAKRKALAE